MVKFQKQIIESKRENKKIKKKNKFQMMIITRMITDRIGLQVLGWEWMITRYRSSAIAIIEKVDT